MIEEYEKKSDKVLQYVGWGALFLLLITLFFAEKADAATVSYNAGEYSAVATISHNGLADDMLVVAVSASTVDDCTATYDGVTMTSAGTPSYITTADEYQYLFTLAGPFSGSATVDVTCSNFAGMYVEGFAGSNAVSGYDEIENDDVSGTISLPATVPNADSAVISICGTRFGPVACTASTGVDHDLSDGGAPFGFGYSFNSSDTSHEWTGTVAVSKAMNILVLDPCVGACPAPPTPTSTPSSTSTPLSAPYIPFLGAIVFFFAFWSTLFIILWKRN